MAQNNVEAYQGIINNSQQANNVLQLNVKDLERQNDKLVQQLDSVRKKLNIKDKELKTSATQTQSINVMQGKGVGGNLIEILKDTVYNDSIQYNDLTKVYYTIGTDTVSIALDIKNTQYLYIYNRREYKNKKNFFKRLFTLDFKKVNRCKYETLNTNELFQNTDVRVIEYTK